MTYARIKERLAPQLEELNGLIHSSLRTSTPLMNEIVEGYLRTKGKQIRPVMVLLCAELLASPTRHTIEGAASLELLHNASLIHDDVIDETKKRRGRDTVNALWDNHISVLTGDFFTSAALEMAVATGSLPIVSAMSALGKELSLGEIHQICNAREQSFSIPAYLEAIGKKTASLFVSCALVGVESVGLSSGQAAPLLEFASLLGLCFQIKDDIFDYFPSENIGKPSGNDLREGKVTLPLLHALNTAPGGEEMKALVRRGDLSAAEIDSLCAFAREHGGIEHAYTTMEEMHSRGTEILCEAYPDSPARRDLLDLFAFIISRQS